MSLTAHGLKSRIPRLVKLQFVCRYIPFGSPYGNSTYIEDFLRYLRQKGFEIECVLLDSSPGGELPWYIIPPVVEELVNISARDNLRFGSIVFQLKPLLAYWSAALLRLVYGLLPDWIKNIYRFAKNRRQQISGHVTTTTNIQLQAWDALATPEEIAFVKNRFTRSKPDVVIANYACLGGVLDALTPNEAVLKVILAHDVHHQRVAEFKKAGIALEGLDWDWEKESVQLRKAQVLLAIQEEDARVIKEMAPLSEVFCTPMSAVCHFYPPKQVPGRCLFVGSHVNHNVHGLQWFLNQVWPIILQSVPDCSLHVCGTVCELFQETFPNVDFLGKIDALKPEYSAAEVCLVPLLVGSGLKIKLVEALSYSRACVSTSIGAQGLRQIAYKALLVADTAENFAAAVHTILTNPDKRRWMEGQAREYVVNRLSPEVAYQPFVERVYRNYERSQEKGVSRQNGSF